MANTQSPLKAIREKCLDCCVGSTSEVKNCPIMSCPLWSFRMGKNPFRQKRELTEEQRLELSERMRKAREAKNTDSCEDVLEDE